VNRLILASASKIRAAMLANAGVAFTVVTADINEDEAKIKGAGARDVAMDLACRKALAVSQAQPGALVLGADQVLEFEGNLLSKSPDMDVLAALLRRLRGKPHALVTAAALARGGQVVWRHVEEARLFMRNFSDGFLAGYLAREGKGVLSSVGGYRLEGFGAQLFERIEGDYFAILGLPLLPVLAALRKEGAIAP